MGVTVLQVFPDSRSGVLDVDKLHKRILHLNAHQAGGFVVDCETYYTISQGQGTTGSAGTPGPTSNRKLHILHNSETPCSTFAILDTGSKQITLSADILFDLLLPRLNHMYQSKKNLKIESKGKRFEVGDFLVKIGTITMSGHYKGILVEVEYLPCVIPALCWSLIREFMQSFLGSCVSTQAPTYLQNRLHDAYSPQDTVQQYLEKFIEFREGQVFTSTATSSSSSSSNTASNTNSSIASSSATTSS
ncbi:mediator complex subunit 20 [Oratosquilla oratoria]|uniref:mediator complex subunit 20 n=1 Tax=Oratosquilla oratoria TaxID=337810 RepID=UPI003F761510